MNNENPQKIKTTPKDFFLWVAVMAALYVSVISFLMLVFEYIEALFPDPLETYRDPYSGGIRFSIASLFVIFPIYIFLTRILNIDLRKNAQKRELGIRKWLTYLTLFVAGVTIIIDLIVLINTFLGGELTARFVLKVASVLVIVGGVFAYYFYSLRGVWEKDAKTSVSIGWVVSAVVLGTVISGFFIIGSPVSQREFRFDERKVSDLQSIQWQVVSFWQSKEKLPETLENLADPIRGYIPPVDPQTGEGYGYRVLGPRAFELCAVFNREGPRGGYNTRVPEPMPVRAPSGAVVSTWEHGEGRTCFERTIDPEFFPPNPRPER